MATDCQSTTCPCPSRQSSLWRSVGGGCNLFSPMTVYVVVHIEQKSKCKVMSGQRVTENIDHHVQSRLHQTPPPLAFSITVDCSQYPTQIVENTKGQKPKRNLEIDDYELGLLLLLVVVLVLLLLVVLRDGKSPEGHSLGCLGILEERSPQLTMVLENVLPGIREFTTRRLLFWAALFYYIFYTAFSRRADRKCAKLYLGWVSHQDCPTVSYFGRVW